MKNKKFTLQILAITIVISSFIACDKDFTQLESDILNDDVTTNFDINNNTWDVITYTDALGPVQVNNSLGTNTLGIYEDLFGKTRANFLTQLTLESFDPDFGEEISIDSVVLTIPYYSSVEEVDEDENITYNIDSVIGRNKLRLRIFESNYFIRDFDPNGDLGTPQNYFSNQSASDSELIGDDVLEGEELIILQGPQTSYNIDNTINISEDGFVLEALNEEDEIDVSERLSPGIRLKLDPAFWQSKIIDVEGESVLSSQNNFSEYFRGLYFKVESVDDNGSFMIFDASRQTANIVIYYTRADEDEIEDDPEATEQATYTLRFGANRLNFLYNEFTNPINQGNSESGDSRIYIKGGSGAIAKIKLFNGEDLDEDDDFMNTFETWKSDFVETDSEGNFLRSKRLVNEANLVFYVDQDVLNTVNPNAIGGEPDRLFLYDIDNKRPLVDYFLDGVNNFLPSISIANHLGPLQRVDDEDPESEGVKYKLKITEHINNLLVRDSTNIELGLAVSINVNLEETNPQRLVLTTSDVDESVPISSVISPRGTVLHGNATDDPSKKVYLEIYYTCTEEDDCND